MESWKIVMLEHDEGSKELGDFFKKIWSDGIIKKDIGNVWLEDTDSNARTMQKFVGDLEGKILTLYGSGSFHHYTYGLCYAIAHKRSDNYMYVHIDNHSDSIYRENGIIKCGSFVENIMEEPEANDILLIGAGKGENPKERKTISQKDLISKQAKDIVRKELKKKLQKDVYASLDLDILTYDDISTDFTQGILELKHLLNVIEVLKEEKNIISADILGYRGIAPSSRYGSQRATYPINLLTYAILAAKITGKDTKELEKLQKYFNKEDSNPRDVGEEFRKITGQLRI